MALLPMYPGRETSPETTTVGSTAIDATTIHVADAAQLPFAPNYLVLGRSTTEIVYYPTDAVAGVFSGVTRAVNGTTPRTWPDGTPVARRWTSADLDAIQYNIIDLDSRIVPPEVPQTSEETLALVQGVANHTYVANNPGSRVSIILPTTAALGDTITIIGKGAGGWGFNQNTGQTIQVGTLVTTPGEGGHVWSGAQFESVSIRCMTANTHWIAVSIFGNLTII